MDSRFGSTKCARVYKPVRIRLRIWLSLFAQILSDPTFPTEPPACSKTKRDFSAQCCSAVRKPHPCQQVVPLLWTVNFLRGLSPSGLSVIQTFELFVKK